jgi:hypothetical protein
MPNHSPTKKKATDKDESTIGAKTKAVSNKKDDKKGRKKKGQEPSGTTTSPLSGAIIESATKQQSRRKDSQWKRINEGTVSDRQFRSSPPRNNSKAVNGNLGEITTTVAPPPQKQNNCTETVTHSSCDKFGEEARVDDGDMTYSQSTPSLVW